MNVKIQGGGNGKYANAGSSFGVISYLTHEDGERLKQGQIAEPLFNQRGEIRSKWAVEELDANKAKLCRNEAKFYVITVSPSEAEIKAMGCNAAERSENFKKFIKEDVMGAYAENFGKGLTQNDILYFAKVHMNRGDKSGEQMHAHIVVSRKDRSNKKKLSPMTNHRNSVKGVIKGGFERTEFYKKVERGFDVCFNFKREYTQSFEYLNAISKCPIEQIVEQVAKGLKPPVVQIQKELTKQIVKNVTRSIDHGIGL